MTRYLSKGQSPATTQQGTRAGAIVGGQPRPTTLFLMILGYALVASGSLRAQIPREFMVQGRLLQAGGAPYQGAELVTLRLYTLEESGSAFAVETDPVVFDAQGVFSTRFGDTAVLDPADFGQALWIGVTVDEAGGGTEHAPRIPIHAAPYALRAVAAETLEVTTDISLGGFTLTNLRDPISDQEVATKFYVDSTRFTDADARAALALPGDLSVAGRIMGVSDPIDPNDAVNLQTLLEAVGGSIDDHSDVSTLASPPQTGQALVWDGAAWVPGFPQSASYFVHEVLSTGDPMTDGASLRSAIEAILDAGPENPNLFRIGPGVYDLGSTPLLPPSYLALIGAGADATILVGDAAGGVLQVPASTPWATGPLDLRDLEVSGLGVPALVSEAPGWDVRAQVASFRSTGPGGVDTLVVSAGSLALRDVDVHLEAGSGGSGVRVQGADAASVTLDRVDIMASGAGDIQGLSILAPGEVALRDVDVDSESSSGAATGIEGAAWGRWLHQGGTVAARGPAGAIGIFLAGAEVDAFTALSDIRSEAVGSGSGPAEALRVDDVLGEIAVQGGSFHGIATSGGEARGVRVLASTGGQPPVYIQGGDLRGEDASIDSASRDIRVLGSVIDGPIEGEPGVLCIACMSLEGTAAYPTPILAADVTFDGAPAGLIATQVQAAIEEVHAAFVAHQDDSSIHFTMAEISISSSQVTDLSSAIATHPAVVANSAKVSADGPLSTHADVDVTTAVDGQVLTRIAGVWRGADLPQPDLADVLANGNDALGQDILNVGTLSAQSLSDGVATLSSGVLTGVSSIAGNSLSIRSTGGTTLTLHASGSGTVTLGSAGDTVRLGAPMDAAGNPITNLPEPTAPDHAATKAYVDLRLLLDPGDTLAVKRDTDTTADCPVWGVWTYDPGVGDAGFCTFVSPP